MTLPAGKTVSVYRREKSYCGGKTSAGLHNFGRVIHDPLISSPFLRVFAWTFAFAASVVLVSFAFGLSAMTLDKPGMRFQGLYRSLLMIPFAIPGFLSLLVWAGLLNGNDFGVVNKLLAMSLRPLAPHNRADPRPVDLRAARGRGCP